MSVYWFCYIWYGLDRNILWYHVLYEDLYNLSKTWRFSLQGLLIYVVIICSRNLIFSQVFWLSMFASFCMGVWAINQLAFIIEEGEFYEGTSRNLLVFLNCDLLKVWMECENTQVVLKILTNTTPILLPEMGQSNYITYHSKKRKFLSKKNDWWKHKQQRIVKLF